MLKKNLMEQIQENETEPKLHLTPKVKCSQNQDQS